MQSDLISKVWQVFERTKMNYVARISIQTKLAKILRILGFNTLYL